MHSSMSGSAAGGGENHGGGGQFYGDHPPAADGDDAFFRSHLAFGGGDDGGVTPSAYSSITDYLQELLDPAELARQLDAPARFPTAGEVIGAEAAPFTPNSSTSGEAAGCKRGSPAPEEGDEEGSAGQGSCRSDEKEQKKKKKGKGEKKARGSRVAFATRSEVDHLDDGYRWRKYGQKAVKNSSFPRSYYRCTAARCGVKKLVERSQQDPSTVVTTYEGRHGHPSPMAAHRGTRMLMATGADMAYSLAALQHQQHGFFPAGADVYGRMSMPPTTAAEYGDMELHADLLPDAAMGYQHGHR